MSDDELLELTTFIGANETRVSYEDIKAMYKDVDTYKVELSTSKLSTSSKEEYEEILLGRNKYLLHKSTLKPIQDFTETLNSIEDGINNKMEDILNKFNVLNSNIKNDLHSIKKSISQFKEMDFKTYNDRMDNIDKIITTFDKVLKY